MKNYLVTGGAGFIGSNFIRYALSHRADWRLVNLDALTYAGNLMNLDGIDVEMLDRYRFIQGSISDSDLLSGILMDGEFSGVIHFAAESHVDRSIHGPMAFVETNVLGTCRLLAVCQQIWEQQGENSDFRFLHISTDEVYGSLGSDGYFTESTPYDPSSPYSASKAASDHFVRAWHRTYGLPTLITNCSNNYGPYQFPEKLIPLMILNIIRSETLPVYGDGKNVRDWLYVMDHCDALIHVLEKGHPGETYNIGGGSERENIEVVHRLCEILDKRLDRSGSKSSKHLVHFVNDRPGHDRRYAIDASRIKAELGWTAQYRFEDALEETVVWYIHHMQWVEQVISGDYRNWIDKNYANREGK